MERKTTLKEWGQSISRPFGQMMVFVTERAKLSVSSSDPQSQRRPKSQNVVTVTATARAAPQMA